MIKAHILLILLIHLSISFDYYSLKLNKIYLFQLNISNNTYYNILENNLTKEQLEELEENIDLPIKISKLNEVNDSYIQTI